jgi:hypothetical protein
MDGAKTSDRWAKTLDQAGLLDEIEDGWTLPDTDATPGASIRVDGHGGGPLLQATEEIDPSSDPHPLIVQQGTVDIAIVDEAPTDPVERIRAPQAEARPSEQPIALQSARATQSGLPRPSRIPEPPAARRKGTRRDDDERRAGDSEPPRWELVRKSKVRISVLPENQRRAQADTLQPIVDEAPEAPRPRRRTSKAPARASAAGDRLAQVHERLELGDYSGALAAAEAIAKSGRHDPEVDRTIQECRRVLVGMYESRIGSFDRVPEVVVSSHELVWRNLDPTTGFVLSRIDGMSTFEDIVDVSGLPRFETCRILNQLLQDGIIR